MAGFQLDATLIAALEHTFSPDAQHRKNAELLLNQASVVQGYVVQLLQISVHSQANPAVQLAASIALKNALKRNWAPPRGRDSSYVGAFVIVEHDKQVVRDNLIECLVMASDKKKAVLLAECVGHIASADFPDNWPNVVPQIVATLNSGVGMRMQYVLLALRKLVQKYEYKNAEERAPLEGIVAVTFPILRELFAMLLRDHNTLDAAEMMKTLCKIYWSATQFKMPVQLMAAEEVTGWFTLLDGLLAKTLPEGSTGAEPQGQPVEVEDRNAWPWWKCKKRVCEIFSRFMSRFGNPQYVDEEYRSFANNFVNGGLAERLVDTVLHTLSLRKRGAFCTDRVVQLCLGFIAAAIEPAKTYKKIKPHIPALVGDVVFPVLCFSDADAELWATDEDEYCRKMADIMQDFVDPRLSGLNLISDLCKMRTKAALPQSVAFISQVFASHAACFGGACASNLV